MTFLVLAIEWLTVSTNLTLVIMPGAGLGCRPGLVQLLVSVKEHFCWISQGCQVWIVMLTLAVVESAM